MQPAAEAKKAEDASWTALLHDTNSSRRDWEGGLTPHIVIRKVDIDDLANDGAKKVKFNQLGGSENKETFSAGRESLGL